LLNLKMLICRFLGDFTHFHLPANVFLGGLALSSQTEGSLLRTPCRLDLSMAPM
jgi:hypothetical protein